jgi:cytochrome c oxidase subunit 2
MESRRRSRPGPVFWLVIILLATVVAIGVAAWVTGTNLVTLGQDLVGSLYPVPAVTTEGAEIRSLYDIVFFIAAVIFFIVEGLIIWTVLRYRRKPGDDELPPQTHGNFVAELVWTVVPTIIVAFLFVVSWQTLNSVEALSAQPDLKARAVAGQFQWTMDYMPDAWDPNDPAEATDPTPPLYTEFIPRSEDGVGGFAFPTGRSIQLYLQSQDVIHAFYVPQFLFKRDVVPGVLNVFEFTIEDAFAGGAPLRGQCAELCGAGHRTMEFDVVAMSGSDFDAWLAAAVERANASPPPPPPSGEPGVTLELVAKDIEFTTKELSAPADAPFTISLDNQDAGVPHDVAIRPVGGGADIFKGETFPGVETRAYAVQPLPAGTYEFICTIHPIPAMTGTLEVGQ